MSATDELLRNNDAYAGSFASGDLPMPPGKQVAVLACMDARLNVYGVLGLHEGDAHVIRNAGGVVTDDAIRSLVISQRLLGTREIVLIHHIGCGMLTFHDDEVKAAEGGDRGRHRPAAPIRAGGLPRRRAGRPPVDRAHQGQPLHPAHRPGARLRIRRRHGQAQRSDLYRRFAVGSRSDDRRHGWPIPLARPEQVRPRQAKAHLAVGLKEAVGVPRLTGMVAQGNQPAAWAYVQLTNLAGDFQAEVRANVEGAFTLYPVAGRWRLITWVPGMGRVDREIEVGSQDLQVQLELG